MNTKLQIFSLIFTKKMLMKLILGHLDTNTFKGLSDIHEINNLWKH